MNTFQKYYTILFLFLGFQSMVSQSDTLVFNTGNKMIGEIKKMEKGVLEIDVPYGKENFKIKWSDIKEIYTSNKFLVTVNTKLYRGKIATVISEKVKIFDKNEEFIVCDLKNILFINEVNEVLKNRFSASLEMGFNLTKSQNTQQFSLRSSLGYKTDKANIEVSYSVLTTNQNESEPAKRTDGLINYRRILINRWYAIGSVVTLSNSTQKIDIRANTQIGVGNYIFANSKGYWGVKSGVNNNLEKFANNFSTLNSWEGYLGSELNLYDMEDFNLALVLMNYSSFTDSGRYRADITFDIKYDLPLNLFVKAGISFNYDNKPTLGASTSDYILRTGFGWEL
ncbi:DUF481 domain-containing protein [Polaribacter gangjinensis]|nr:DUF481 domain-containing protein [Polaribacter gangjinensis]